MTPQEEFDQARATIEAALPMTKNFVRFDIFRKAYDAGALAKKRGWDSVSPYYEDDLRTPYFLAGYHGLEFVMPELKKAN